MDIELAEKKQRRPRTKGGRLPKSLYNNEYKEEHPDYWKNYFQKNKELLAEKQRLYREKKRQQKINLP